MNHYLFRFQNKKNLSVFQKRLSLEGLEQIYTIFEPESGSWLIGGFSLHSLQFSPFPEAVLLESGPYKEPNWEEQAREFSPYYKDGYIELDLTSYGIESKLRFHPGSGFGDLSHPTTRLMLSLLPPYIKGRLVLDIGSGNGVLTLAAQALGAKRSYGVEIETLALEHSIKNLELNGLKNITFHSPEELPSFIPEVILCNMITSEQDIAFAFYPQINVNSLILVISGILTSQKESYLKKAKEKDWSLVAEDQQDGWIALVFQS